MYSPAHSIERGSEMVEVYNPSNGQKSFWRRHWDLVLVAVIIVLVVASAVAFGSRGPEVNPKETMLFEGHPYSNFQQFAGTPGGVRAKPLSFDSLWGPMTRNTQVEINGQTYTAADCVGEGHRDMLIGPGIVGPYDSIACYAAN